MRSSADRANNYCHYYVITLRNAGFAITLYILHYHPAARIVRCLIVDIRTVVVTMV
jgi:hypothetical protein